MSFTGVLQVHPSLRCNLRCHHCYTSSGPDQRGALDDDDLAALVSDAAALGYRAIGVSGGEPLLFGGLEALLAAAKAAGMRTMITTNGTLLTDARMERLAPVLDLAAFSLDGPPELHDAVRAKPWAFDRLERGLRVAQRWGLRRGLLYTATAASWPHLSWGAELAVRYGCALFQVHAIEGVGRARAEMDGQLLGDHLIDRVHAAATELATTYADRLRVQVDLASRSELEHLRPGSVLGSDGRPVILTVEEDGSVLPMTHGIDRRYRVAELGRERLATALPRFLAEGPALGDLVARTRSSLLADPTRDHFDLYAELREASRTGTGATATAVPMPRAG